MDIDQTTETIRTSIKKAQEKHCSVINKNTNKLRKVKKTNNENNE